jgi:hypothetical protein
MAGDDGKLGVRQVAVDHMEVGPAHGARFHRHADLAWSRRRQGALFGDHGRSQLLEDHRLHGIASMKRGFHPLLERLDFAKVGCAPLTLALTKIGDQSVLARIIHRPAR